MFLDAGLTDSKRRSHLLPENFGSIQIVKNRLKKDRQRCEGVTTAGKAERRQHLLNDAECEVAKQTASVTIVDIT